MIEHSKLFFCLNTYTIISVDIYKNLLLWTKQSAYNARQVQQQTFIDSTSVVLYLTELQWHEQNHMMQPQVMVMGKPVQQQVESMLDHIFVLFQQLTLNDNLLLHSYRSSMSGLILLVVDDCKKHNCFINYLLPFFCYICIFILIREVILNCDIVHLCQGKYYQLQMTVEGFQVSLKSFRVSTFNSLMYVLNAMKRVRMNVLAEKL